MSNNTDNKNNTNNKNNTRNQQTDKTNIYTNTSKKTTRNTNSNSNKIAVFGRKIYGYGDSISQRIGVHHTFLLAAGLAFNILLYAIPLILIIIYLVNAILKTDYLIELLKTSLIDFLPKTDYYKEIIFEVIKEIQHIAAGSTLAGIVGLVVLLWISSTVISTLNSCISIIFETEQPHYIYTKLKDIGTTILLTLLILMSSVIIPVLNFVGAYINEIFPDFLSGLFSNIVLILSPFVISFLTFYFMYGVVPSSKTKKIPRKLVINTTLIAVVLTEVSRRIFTWYILTIANYTRFYGTYAILVTLAVWLYYSCFLILFSAELSKYFWDKKEDSPNKLNNLEKSNNKTFAK